MFAELKKLYEQIYLYVLHLSPYISRKFTYKDLTKSISLNHIYRAVRTNAFVEHSP